MYRELDFEICPFCKGTGFAKCLDINKLAHIPDGNYDFQILYKQYYEFDKCPEDCKPLN